MSNVVSVQTPSTPIIDQKTGMMAFEWIKWFQNVSRAINAAFDQQGTLQGVIGAQATVASRSPIAKLGNILTNISNTGTVESAGIPSPAVGALGGVEAIAAVAHKWVYELDTSGVLHLSRPAFSDISGTAAGSQLPTPTATTLGGVESIGPTAHEWIYEIDTSGVPHLSQPAFSDVSGSASAAQVPALSALSGQITGAQLPSSGLSVTIATAKLTTLGANGSMTFSNGILTAHTDAT